MSAQSPSSYDLIKIPPRSDIKSENYNNRGRADISNLDNRDDKTRPKETARENFMKFLAGLNTTVKDAVLPIITKKEDISDVALDLSATTNFEITPDITIVESEPNDANILATPELILSDILAIDIDALKQGDTITLPNDIEVSLDNGLLNFSIDGELVAIPALSLEQFETIALNFENNLWLNDGALIDEISIDDIIASPLLIPQNIIPIGRSIGENTTQANPLLSLKKVIDVLQNMSAQKNDLVKPILTPKTDVIIDTKANTLGSMTSDKSSSVLGNPNTSSAQGLGANGIQNMNAGLSLSGNTQQNNKAAGFDPNLAIAAMLAGQDKTASDGDETLTQFLNNNNLRVVKDGYLQGTQPLATAQVNVILSKMANGSQFKRLSVRLDPPELGRVDIRLSSRTSDNSLKAHIIVERPEALTLLRRDLHQLEKMLSQSGLNLDSDSISFELASDDGQGDSQTQEALKDLWRERNENALNRNLASNLQSEQQDNDTLSLNDNEDFYQSDNALNIKV